ncbi:hypothetical protein ABPG75_011055 [Micractinium tetrahymenae]
MEGPAVNPALLLLAREAGGPRRTHERLRSWAEASFTRNSSAQYAAFQPPPRSTIALSYNCDGTLLASTHGDHTVKLTCCATGRLVRALSGHRRTPWVVRFHPRKPSLLASGSLDHEVRLWDADTGQCIARHTFGKPIASLAFHVCADVLAIGCGHKLYMWEYTTQGKLPVIVLKTRRSMRAVHFHPHGLPIVLTAEVQDPSPTPQLPATLTEQGPYVQQRGSGAAAEEEPATPAAPARAGGRGSAAAAPPSGEVPIPSLQLLQGAAGCSGSNSLAQQQQQQQDTAQPAAGVYVATADGPVPVDQLSSATAATSSTAQGPQPMALDLPAAALALSTPMHALQLRSSASSPALAAAAAAGEGPSTSGRHPQGGSSSGRPGAPGWVPPNSAQLPPSMVPTGWELPFPSSLFSGGQQAAAGTAGRGGGGLDGQGHGQGPAGGDSGWAATAATLPQVMAAFSAAAWNIIGEEQPPRVRLRMWRFDASKPTALLAVLGAEQASSNLLLQIPDAVLCSEMGVHFSPDGRFLACTVACRAPLPAAVGVAGALLPDADADVPSQAEIDAALAAALGSNAGVPLHSGDQLPPTAAMRASGAASHLLERSSGAGSPAAAAAAAAAVEAAAAAAAASMQPRPERVVFEVRVFSIDGPTFGQVVGAKRIRAAHCLTSVQFSPCCQHILLAYGKKHISLLRSLVADRGSVLPLHTILEVFRLRDMELVRVLPSADDEINAACFHPLAGGGIAYGTKEGRLRTITHDRSRLAAEGEPAAGASGSAAGSAGRGASGGSLVIEDEHPPSQRELDNLREWVLTQQWLRQQALGGAELAAAANPAAAAQQLQAMQQLWEQGGRG